MNGDSLKISTAEIQSQKTKPALGSLTKIGISLLAGIGGCGLATNGFIKILHKLHETGLPTPINMVAGIGFGLLSAGLGTAVSVLTMKLTDKVFDTKTLSLD